MMVYDDERETREEVCEECEHLLRAMPLTCSLVKRQKQIGPMPNVRIGLSAGTQKYLDARWPFLRDTPAAFRHLSLQPLLEPIKLPVDLTPDNLAWVVVMREVGPGARPMNIEWVGDIRDQCDARGISFFWETTVFDETKSVNDER